MLKTIWQQWCKYSIGLTNHVVFHPAIPFRWQRMIADSNGRNPLLQAAGVRETPFVAAGLDVCRFDVSGSRSDFAMVFFHGGGFTVGSIASHRPMCRQLAKACGVPVYSVAYRLAPEHPFPAAPDDCERAVYALMEQLSLNAAHIILAGDSAGGNLALVTALRLLAQGQVPAAVMLLSPWVDPFDMTLGWVFDPVINPLWGWVSAQAYAGGQQDAQNPEVSPLYADFTGLPPVLLQAGSEEILLPQIRRLAEKLRAAGVDVDFTEYCNLWHSGQMSANINAVAAQAVRHCGDFVQRVTSSATAQAAAQIDADAGSTGETDITPDA